MKFVGLVRLSRINACTFKLCGNPPLILPSGAGLSSELHSPRSRLPRKEKGSERSLDHSDPSLLNIRNLLIEFRNQSLSG